MGVSRGVEFQAREEMCLDRRPGTAATTQPILGFQEASQEEEKDALLQRRNVALSNDALEAQHQGAYQALSY